MRTFLFLYGFFYCPWKWDLEWNSKLVIWLWVWIFVHLFCVLGLRYVVHLVHLLPSNAIVVSHFHNYTFSISLVTVTWKKFGLFSECYRSIQGSFKQRSRPSRCLYKSCSSFQVNFSNSPLLLKHWSLLFSSCKD